jgi:hypothetical protein
MSQGIIALRFFLSSILVLASFCPFAKASLVYPYDFPGNPGSGLAVDQTNSQPTDATFSDFTRNTVVQTPGSGEFGSSHWSLSSSLDSATYEGLSIAASAGFHLNLSSLTFSARITGAGPANVEVALFLNGSPTAYAAYNVSPTGTMSPYSFNFTPLTDADNVTSAIFRFYGWNANGLGGQLYLDNVGTYGDISSVPEMPTLLPVMLVAGCAMAGTWIQQLRVRNLKEPFS